MNTQSDLIQTLESRRLLSANMSLPGILQTLTIAPPAVFGAAPVNSVGASSAANTPTTTSTTPTATLVPVTTPTPTVGARATSLVGQWDGKIKTKIFLVKLKVSATLNITAQTDTTLTGSIEIKGKTFSGTFTGKINPATGRFKWKVKDGSASISLTGRLNTAGTVIVGDITAKYSGLKVKGSFHLDKVS